MRAVARRPVALAAASVAAMVAMNTLDLPLTARRLRALAGGEPVLDLRIGYGQDEAWRLLDRLGEAGRASYLQLLWTVDLLLPLLFGLTLWTAIRAGALARWRWIAIVAAAIDYLENGALSVLIVGFPVEHPATAALAAAATAAKFTLYALATACAAGGAWKASRAAAGEPAGPKGRAP